MAGLSFPKLAIPRRTFSNQFACFYEHGYVSTGAALGNSGYLSCLRKRKAASRCRELQYGLVNVPQSLDSCRFGEQNSIYVWNCRAENITVHKSRVPAHEAP